MEHQSKANGAAPDRAFAELRRLILGDPAIRAGDTGDILPAAIRLRSGKDSELRTALQPLLEDALRTSIRKDPELMAVMLFPIVGAAVRKAVASAFQSVIQGMNQVAEQSLSWRGVQWRFEALRTGRSYSEILLARSLLYRVEQVFLIHKTTGLLLQQRVGESAIIQDPDLVSGMLTAIQDFVRDSFGARPDQELETLRVGDLDVWMQHGPNVTLAAVIRGTPPKALESVFAATLEQICLKKGPELARFDGDTSPFFDCQEDLKKCFLGQAPARSRSVSPMLWVAGGLALLAFAVGLYFGVRDARRWSQYLQRVRSQPGIVVTEAERPWGGYFIAGLRDPLAADPAALLAGSGIEASKVHFRWEAYHSLRADFEAARRLTAEQQYLEAWVLHFAQNDFHLGPEALDGMGDLARHIGSLQAASVELGRPVRIEIRGHADDIGLPDVNGKLSLDRAEAVRIALAAAGVPEAIISTAGAGTAEPLRPGGSDLNRPYNRAVSFRVQVAAR